MPRYVVVIPVYNHDRYIERVVAAVLGFSVSCILIDDGSSEPCRSLLAQIAAASPGEVTLVRSATNQGKGAAVLTGIRTAHELGFTHALQIDADGQHNVSDIPLLIELSRNHPDALITGTPQYDESVPKHRLYLRYLTHAMVSINTLTFRLRDAMCGFRIYPVEASLDLAQRAHIGARMDFDIDMFVRMDWDGVQIIEQRTRVKYPVDGVSHFRMLRDNARITSLHIRMLFGMLVRAPRLLTRKTHTS